MSDLISRSALIEELWEERSGVIANRGCYSDAEEVADSICSIISIVDDQPTIEAAPVVHGEWVVKEDEHGFAKWEECSVCGLKLKVVGYGREMKFCYECGADMRKGSAK